MLLKEYLNILHSFLVRFKILYNFEKSSAKYFRVKLKCVNVLKYEKFQLNHKIQPFHFMRIFKLWDYCTMYMYMYVCVCVCECVCVYL